MPKLPFGLRQPVGHRPQGCGVDAEPDMAGEVDLDVFGGRGRPQQAGAPVHDPVGTGIDRGRRHWQVTGEKGRGAIVAHLRLTDAGGTSLEVDSVTAELVDDDGVVTVSQPMTFEEGRYVAELGRPDPGRYTLRGIAVVDGFSVRSSGPTFVRAGQPTAAG